MFWLPSRVVRAAVMAVVAALAGAGCGVWPGPRPDPAATSPGPELAWEVAELAWRPCPEILEEVLGDRVAAPLLAQLAELVMYHCTTLPVPRSWDDPEVDGTFGLALVRARRIDQRDRIGSLLLNPGGPGGSGVETAVFLTAFAPEYGLPLAVTTRFDIIGFDPRGVERSDPVQCYTPDALEEIIGAEPDPVDDTEFEAARFQVQQLARVCDAKYGDTLNYLSTRQVAHDLDAIRAAVGDQELTYLGYSYGSLLGAVYAQLFPDRIRAMVLDGAIDPTLDQIAMSQRQAEGFERAFDNFAAWCDGAAQCPLRPDARAAVVDAIEAARRSPVPGRHGREATAGWVFSAVIAALYVENWWPELAAAIEALDRDDPSGVFSLVDRYTGRRANGSYSNLFDVLIAVRCIDDAARVTPAQARALQDQWREDYPLFGAPFAAGLAGCTYWPAEPDPYPIGPAEGAPPIVVVGTTGDPATPYESTAALAGMLGVGVVVTWQGEGHGAYPGDPCVDDAVDTYLVDLVIPEDGLVC